MEEATNRRILNGWKQISHHIDRGVRTAQRWEALLGMPVHRPALKDRSAVVAFSDELESWLSRTSPDARNEWVARDEEATNEQSTSVGPESNERLLRVLDNMSTLVQQSCDLLSQVQMLQEQLRRSRRSRRSGSRTRPRVVCPPRRSVDSVLPFSRRNSGSPLGRTQVSLIDHAHAHLRTGNRTADSSAPVRSDQDDKFVAATALSPKRLFAGVVDAPGVR